MPGRPAAMDGGPAQGDPQAPHRFARDGELVDLAQLLGQVRVVEPRIAIAEQDLDLPGDGHRQAAARGASPALMS
jgi:hypothetical protein